MLSGSKETIDHGSYKCMNNKTEIIKSVILCCCCGQPSISLSPQSNVSERISRPVAFVARTDEQDIFRETAMHPQATGLDPLMISERFLAWICFASPLIMLQETLNCLPPLQMKAFFLEQRLSFHVLFRDHISRQPSFEISRL